MGKTLSVKNHEIAIGYAYFIRPKKATKGEKANCE